MTNIYKLKCLLWNQEPDNAVTLHSYPILLALLAKAIKQEKKEKEKKKDKHTVLPYIYRL